MSNVKLRIELEHKIVRAFCKSALADGCLISVYDGEEYAIKKSDSITAIMKEIHSTDEDTLVIWKDGVKLGWVALVYGNDGWDVISDYTINLEYLMNDAHAISAKYQ